MNRKRFTNQEIISFIVDDIKDNPSSLFSDIQMEKDFISLFEGKSNVELAGVITTEPQAQNIFFANFYQRIVRKGIVEALNVDNPYSIFKKDDLTYGDRWSRFATDVMEVKEFDPSASPMPQSKPRLAECFSDEPFRKLVEFTYSRDQIIGMFLKDEGIDELLVNLLNKQKQSLEIFISNEIYNKIILYNGTENSPFGKEKLIQNNELFYLAFEGILDASHSEIEEGGDKWYLEGEVINQRILNLKALIIEYANKMARPSRDFNIGDTDGKFMTSIPKGEGILLINENILSVIEIHGDTFFKDKGDIKKYFKEIVPIPHNPEYLGEVLLFGIVDPNWLEYRIMLDKTLDWTNPRALYTNYFSHLWFGILVNPFVSSFALTIGEM